MQRSAIHGKIGYPGTKLGEDDLGNIYGVSRTLVRLALQTLARGGIVIIKKNRGAFVAPPSIAQTHEVFEVRRLIELAIATHAAKFATPTFAEALKAHLIAEGVSLAATINRQPSGSPVTFTCWWHRCPVTHCFNACLVNSSPAPRCPV